MKESRDVYPPVSVSCKGAWVAEYRLMESRHKAGEQAVREQSLAHAIAPLP